MFIPPTTTITSDTKSLNLQKEIYSSSLTLLLQGLTCSWNGLDWIFHPSHYSRLNYPPPLPRVWTKNIIPPPSPPGFAWVWRINRASRQRQETMWADIRSSAQVQPQIRPHTSRLAQFPAERGGEQSLPISVLTLTHSWRSGCIIIQSAFMSNSA